MFTGNNKNTRKTSLSSFWCFLLLTLNIFHTFFVDFEQVNLCRINITVNALRKSKFGVFFQTLWMKKA